MAVLKWIWASYETLTLWQWLVAIGTGDGLGWLLMLNFASDWALWQQALASAGVAFVWLIVISWVIRLFKKPTESTDAQSQVHSPSAQQQEAQGGSNSPITQMQTGDIYQGDVYNLSINITPEVLGEMMTEKEPQQPNIHVESHDQQGGITAGIVNILGDLGPKIDTTDITHTEMPDGLHRYETILTVGSQYSVPEIRITAYADSIQSLDVAPQRGGMHMFGHTGKREGYHFTNIQNAAGKYRIRVVTTKPEEVKIDVG